MRWTISALATAAVVLPGHYRRAAPRWPGSVPDIVLRITEAAGGKAQRDPQGPLMFVRNNRESHLRLLGDSGAPPVEARRSCYTSHRIHRTVPAMNPALLALMIPAVSAPGRDPVPW